MHKTSAASSTVRQSGSSSRRRRCAQLVLLVFILFCSNSTAGATGHHPSIITPTVSYTLRHQFPLVLSVPREFFCTPDPRVPSASPTPYTAKLPKRGSSTVPFYRGRPACGGQPPDPHRGKGPGRFLAGSDARLRSLPCPPDAAAPPSSPSSGCPTPTPAHHAALIGPVDAARCPPVPLCSPSGLPMPQQRPLHCRAMVSTPRRG